MRNFLVARHLSLSTLAIITIFLLASVKSHACEVVATVVEYEGADDPAGPPAKRPGDTVCADETVKVPQNGHAKFNLIDDTSFDMSGGAEVKFDEFVINPNPSPTELLGQYALPPLRYLSTWGGKQSDRPAPALGIR